MSEEQKVFGGGVAVITGAGSGLGAGLARHAASIGMTVVVADIAEERARAVAADIQGMGGRAEAITVDVAKPDDLDRFAEDVHSRFGDVRLLINNAGIETLGNAWEIPTARWEATLNINIHGVVHGVRAFAPRMLAAGKPACIANLSSIGGLSVMPTQTAYIMTKHAIQAYTECLYLEMQRTGKPVQVSCIVPGMVKTNIFDAAGGTGEPATAVRHRAVMRELMATYGMELDEGVRIIFEKLAAGAFWVDTQPDMTNDVLRGRIDFFQRRGYPELGAQAKALLDG